MTTGMRGRGVALLVTSNTARGMVILVGAGMMWPKASLLVLELFSARCAEEPAGMHWLSVVVSKLPDGPLA